MTGTRPVDSPRGWRSLSFAAAAFTLILALSGCRVGSAARADAPGGPVASSGSPAAPGDAWTSGAGVDKPAAAPDADRPAPARKPRLALVFDDLGWGQAGSAELLAMKGPFTFAVLPHTPHAEEAALSARRGGHEVFLHLPMEPQNSRENDPGPYAIRTGMSAAEIRDRVESLLDAVPDVAGVNNHMGSRATEVPEVMAAVLEVLRDRRLPWLDSHTSPRSIAPAEARRLGVPTAVNGLFFDVVRDPAVIKAALRRAVNEARERGEFIAIGHPHPTVVEALREVLPELATDGVELVPASALMHPAAPPREQKPPGVVPRGVIASEPVGCDRVEASSWRPRNAC